MDPRSEQDFVTIGGSLKTAEPTSLPEILDVLVVGGGPAGTAAAFRAKELGFSALVIDYDDLMKRIRDYSKEKEILPDFGGGDTLTFPEGKDLIAKLRFDPMDKDDMVDAWKGYYRDGNIPARIGIELLGLGTRTDGVWEVNCFSRRLQKPVSYRARHVVIAIGRGVPRRFDIPGNANGIAFRLDDPAGYVGRPVCVIGGGTSAAEAVIAISCAKFSAEDKTLVYWSYRGESMPKVSDSLSKVFFEAFVANGNIVYLRRSEPAAVVVGYDRREYLSIRIDRQEMEGRPAQTVHFEFPKEDVVACIGEDVPKALLESIGIQLGLGTDGKERLLVTPELETQRECVYIVGDLLAPFYWEADRLDAPCETWRKTKHLGNIKSALIDGVRVAELIRSRMNGGKPIASRAPDRSEKSAPQPREKTSRKTAEPVALPEPPVRLAEPPVPPPEAPVMESFELVREFLSDEEESVTIAGPILRIGRSDCDINLDQDVLASKHHASVVFDEAAKVYRLRDEDSEHGTFLKLGKEDGPITLPPGSFLLVSKQRINVCLIREGSMALVHRDDRNRLIAEYDLPEGETTVGKSAQISLAVKEVDLTLSREHFKVIRRGETLQVENLSRNGTLIRLTGGPYELRPGTRFVVGHAHFLFRRDRAARPSAPRPAPLEAAVAKSAPARPSPSQRSAAKAKEAAPIARQPQGAAEKKVPEKSPARVSEKPAPKPPPEPVEKPKAPAKPAGNAPCVDFEGCGAFPVSRGQSVLDIALKNGVTIKYDCKEGICGFDPIEVLEGEGLADPPGDAEEGGLAEAARLLGRALPANCRLACSLKNIKGPIRVRVINES